MNAWQREWLVVLEGEETRMEERRARAIGYTIACLVAIGALFQVAIIDQIASINKNPSAFVFAIGTAFGLYWCSAVGGLGGATLQLKSERPTRRTRDQQAVLLAMSILSGGCLALCIAQLGANKPDNVNYGLFWAVGGAMAAIVVGGAIALKHYRLLGMWMHWVAGLAPLGLLAYLSERANLPKPIPIDQMVRSVGPALLVLVLIHIILVLPDLWDRQRLRKLRAMIHKTLNGTILETKLQEQYLTWKQSYVEDKQIPPKKALFPKTPTGPQL